jgi:hypothetical protein
MAVFRIILSFLSFGLLSFFIEGDVPKFFDIEKVDSSTMIIAYGGFVDENGKNYNFIIDESDEIKKFISGIKYGEPQSNVFSQRSLEIHLVQDHRDITFLTIVPEYKRVFANDGVSYKFDLNQLEDWRAKYRPLQRFAKGVNFKTQKEFEEFLNKQKQNPNFLYSSYPLFRYEGSFEIQFPKSNQFKNPQAIMDYLKPFIKEVEPDEEKYSLSYELDDKNMTDRNQFTITISGSKKLFNELKVENYQNSNWLLIQENASFYYKK